MKNPYYKILTVTLTVQNIIYFGRRETLPVWTYNPYQGVEINKYLRDEGIW